MTRLEYLLSKLYKSGLCSFGETVAIYGAVTTVQAERNEDWTREFGTIAEEALDGLVKERLVTEIAK